MTKLILLWHRKDLRISDNIALFEARKITPKIVSFFCFDPNILERDDIAPVRINYLLGCLQELQQSYQKLGGKLLFIQGEPTQIIPDLAAVLQAEAVFWNQDVEPYSRKRDEQVKQALKEQGINSQTYWDQLLHFPGEILTKSNDSYKVYTPFWKNWWQQSKPSVVTPLNNLEGLNNQELEQIKTVNIVDLPTAQSLGYSWNNPLILPPAVRMPITPNFKAGLS